jgi:hypothetical protein
MMDGSDWLQNFGTSQVHSPVHFQKVKGHAPYLWIQRLLIHAQIQWTRSVPFFCTCSSGCLDVSFDDPDLLLVADLMAVVAPPPELVLSPNLEEFKCFKGFTFEIPPASPDVLGSRRCFPS